MGLGGGRAVWGTGTKGLCLLAQGQGQGHPAVQEDGPAGDSSACPVSPAPRIPCRAGRADPSERAEGMLRDGDELSSGSLDPQTASEAPASACSCPATLATTAWGRGTTRGSRGGPKPASSNFCGFERKKRALHPQEQLLLFACLLPCFYSLFSLIVSPRLDRTDAKMEPLPSHPPQLPAPPPARSSPRG